MEKHIRKYYFLTMVHQSSMSHKDCQISNTNQKLCAIKPNMLCFDNLCEAYNSYMLYGAVGLR